ncbi:MAG: diacylglycerol kinase family protein [Ferruginibacter sp.]
MKLLRSFVYAFTGIRSAFASELNFRIHAVVAAGVMILAAALHISVPEWLLVGFCIALVLVTEMLNTAIEKLCDIVQPGLHPAIKKVKDIAAGAVLVAAIFSSITGLIIFVPKIMEYCKSF